jgi:uncharacterized lipoprotein YmbA
VKKKLSFIFLLFLFGCGSSKFYHLYPTIPVKEGSFRVSKRVIGVAEVKLADYIDKPQIVTQKDNSRVDIHEKENWAGDFAKNIQEVITQNLNRLLFKKYTFIALPAEEVSDDKYRIFVSIDRFDSKDTEVTLDGRWSIKKIPEDSILIMKKFHYTINGENLKDKDEKLKENIALRSILLEKLSKDIAKFIKVSL